MILVEQKENYIILKLNRPDNFNSFTMEMSKMLQDKLLEYDKDDSIRAILLTGEGKAFCAGQDLIEVQDEKIKIKDIVENTYIKLINIITKLEKPVICAVNGVAAGAGANIALACDITIAKKSANFIQAFSSIGLVPDSGGSYFLPRLIGKQKAAGLMFTGEKISSEESEQHGMIYKSIEDNEYEEYISNFMNLISNRPTKALSLTKKLLSLSYENNLEEMMKLERDFQIESVKSYDYNEGITAFFEKRKAKFIGK